MAEKIDMTLAEIYEYLGVTMDSQMTDEKCNKILAAFNRNFGRSAATLEEDVDLCRIILLDSIELVELLESGVVIHQARGCAGGGCTSCGNH
ncbi:MAG: hypothetical protein D6B27_04565 [Gammaproteobacteria bacterium]|nr:MAG: hypothetical protein D6B27_04565 [Gammaproteobacteria bacterium]